MKRAFDVTPEAEAELAEAKAWYDAEQPGLGDKLIEDVQRVFTRIQRNPELYGIICDEVRYARADRFPYGVFFQYETPTVVVLSVRHGSREPKWSQAEPS
jgi:plasmid stabilization system protein ParE